ncbi:GATC (predicted) [Pycnogonum litorale]
MKHPQLDSDKPKIKIDNETAKLLERLALVELADTDGIKVIEQIVNFCEPLKHVNTEGVEPMVSVLESRNLHLRDDVEEKMNREEILINAAKIEESYFVAPPGNIPLQQDQTHKSQRQKT